MPLIFFADLPDDTGVRDLHDRRIGWVLHGTGWSGTPAVSRDTEVHQVERAVGTELAVHRAVNPVERTGGRGFDEGLIGRLGATLAAIGLFVLVLRFAVERESLEDDAPILEEGDPDDVVPLDGVAVPGLKTEIALASDERIPVIYLVARVAAPVELPGDEVESDRCNVSRENS